MRKLTAGLALRFLVFCRDVFSEMDTESPSARNHTSESCGRPSGPTVPSVPTCADSRLRWESGIALITASSSLSLSLVVEPAGQVESAAARSGKISGGNVGVGQVPVAEPGRVLALEAQRRVVVPLEQRDEQGEGQEVVRAQLEELDVVVAGQGLPLVAGELQPGAAFRARAVEQQVGLLRLPPSDRPARVFPVALDQVRVAVDGVEELVDQVLAHRAAVP